MTKITDNPEKLQALKNLKALARAGVTKGWLFFMAKHSCEEQGATDFEIDVFVKEGLFEYKARHLTANN